MKETTKYWKGLDELNETPEFKEKAENEFPEFLPIEERKSTKSGDEDDSGRRDFLKLMGFSVAAVSLAACETPVKKAIPYVNKPETVDPGVPNYYASTYMSGGDYASIVVKNREGRPIKIEPNRLSSITGAGLGARVTASVLDLYDDSRLKSFKKGKNDISIKDADAEIKKGLKDAKTIRIISPTITGPTTLSLIEDFKKKYAGADVQHIQFDPISYKGISEANGGKIPSYDFSKADVIVSTADFHGTWISPIEFSGQYGETRKLRRGKNEKKTMSRHYQFESTLTLTGATADYRTPIKASEEPLVILELYNKVVGGNYSTKGLSESAKKAIAKAAKELKAAKGKSLVVSGSNDTKVQLFVAAINEKLGNVGKTVDLENATLVKASGDEAKLGKFVKDALDKKIDAVILLNSNLFYQYFGCDPSWYKKYGNSEEHKEKIFADIKTKVAITDRADETASQDGFYIATNQHWLEKWGDAQPKEGYFSIGQPTINPIFKGTRAAEESLMAWAGISGTFYDYLKAYWEKNLFPLQSQEILFESFWNKTLRSGVFEPGKKLNVTPAVVENQIAADSTSQETTPAVVAEEDALLEAESSDNTVSLSEAARKIKEQYKPAPKGQLEFVAYESTQMGDGAGANNPWLQELPDPISKVTWDNYVAISAYDAETNFGKQPRDPKNPALKQGDIVKIVAPNLIKIEAPVLIQPGQAPGTVSMALGYGRDKAGKLASGIEKRFTGKEAIGISAFPFVRIVDGNLCYYSNVTIEKASGSYEFAQTQTHHTIMGRDIIQGAYLSDYKEGNTGKVEKLLETYAGKKKPEDIDLWAPQNEDTHKHPIHKWGLSIDLNSCFGCGSCHIACQSENNIPVVGKDEVRRRRDMHWLRIDRYYSSDMSLEKGEKEGKGKIGALAEMENPADNPKVTFMPMMCQHCAHAPCESVCPVAATSHSTEGLNQMAYNRCIGTRYCANNCPYKVRRFNWFNYSDKPWSEREFRNVNTAMNSDLGRMVLNPDVTVRARGVMEKCSMCVQRIQEGKLKAKIEKRKVKDGDIEVACASACPTNAITFGDMNDPESRIYKERNEDNGDRTYQVLEELNVQPGVTYLTKIRNEEKDGKIKF